MRLLHGAATALGLTASLMSFNDPVGAQVVGPVMDISSGTCASEDGQPYIATSGLHAVATWHRSSFGGPNVCSAVSRDGGQTWLPGGPFEYDTFNESLKGYPTVCLNDSREAFAAVNAFAQDLDQFISGRKIFVYKGSFDDAAWHWQRISDATPYLSPEGQGLDGLRIMCDRSRDYLYIVYTQTLVRYSGRIQFIRSTDGGGSWSLPVELSGPGSNTAQMVLGPDGELYVAWMDYNQNAIVGRKSIDGGESFGSEFRMVGTQENLGLGPSGWFSAPFRSPTRPRMPCMDVPAFYGFAIDNSAGPRRGALYLTWTEHGVGIPAPQRGVITEIEPNAPYFSQATPFEIGDDLVGFMGSADEPPYEGDCDVFTFEGVAGTTIMITGIARECLTFGGCFEPPLSFALYCGSDTTALARIGCGQVSSNDGTPIPPLIYTLPTTGRYYLFAGCSSNGNINYHLETREYQIPDGQAARDHRDVVLASSTDGGATWSNKVRVNDDAPLHDNAIPALTVDGQGLVHVAWYDRRDEPSCGKRVHTCWTWSTDGGATFQPSRRVSEQASDAGSITGQLHDIVRWYAGDHMALHAEGNRVHLLWTYVPIGGGARKVHGVRITDVPTSIAVPRFVAEREGDQVVLSWRVADGREITGFRIHRAAGPGTEFEAVGDVAATGLSGYRWEDATAVAGLSYRYRLEVLRWEAPSIWEGPVEVASTPLVAALRWRGAVPNPFDEAIDLVLDSPVPVATSVRVFDVAGHLITELRPEIEAGQTRVRWNGRDHSGRPVAPGVYLVRAEVQGRAVVRRVIRMR